MVGPHLRPRPPSHALPSAAAAPSSRVIISDSRGGSLFTRQFPGLKMQMGTARLRFVSRCAAADGAREPSPEEGPGPMYRRFRDAMDKYGKEYRAELIARGALTAQDAMVQELQSTLFRDEEDKLQTYVRGIDSNGCLLCREGRALAQMVCFKVAMALRLSAAITANAHLRINGSSEMSSHTVEQIIRTYVSTFLKTSGDACHRKVDRKSIISFLDALRGLAAISHILFEDTLALVNSLEHSSSNYSPEFDVEAANHELQRNITELEKNFAAGSEKEAYELLRPTLRSATDQVAIFVYRTITLRKKAIAHVS